MKNRCKTAELIGNGTIIDYELSFKWFATISPKSKGVVPIVVWGIDEADEKSLDLYEGVSSNMYRKENISVTLDSGEVIEGLVYILDKITNKLPSIQYYMIIRQGYIENHLPTDYLDTAYIKAIKESEEGKK